MLFDTLPATLVYSDGIMANLCCSDSDAQYVLYKLNDSHDLRTRQSIIHVTLLYLELFFPHQRTQSKNVSISKSVVLPKLINCMSYCYSYFCMSYCYSYFCMSYCYLHLSHILVSTVLSERRQVCRRFRGVAVFMLHCTFCDTETVPRKCCGSLCVEIDRIAQQSDIPFANRINFLVLWN